MQRFLNLFISILLYMFQVVPPSIIKSTNCTYNIRYCQTNTVACRYRGWDRTASCWLYFRDILVLAMHGDMNVRRFTCMFKIVITIDGEADKTMLTVVCLNFANAPKWPGIKTVSAFAPKNVFLNTVLVFPDKIISFNLNLACDFINDLEITKAELLACLLHKAIWPPTF
jgi:hypothetical protein